jgi:uridine kinase
MKTRSTVIDNLADTIARVHRDHPIRVGIDGFAAAGKTTLADELVGPLEQRGRVVLRLSIDGFHNPAEIRHRKGRHCPVGYYQDSFNHEAIVTHVLTPLGPHGNRNFKSASYDYRTDTSVDAEWEKAPTDAILLFDGIFLHRPELKDHWDFTVFVHADFSVMLDRACRRDLEKFQSVDRVRESFERRFIPGSQMYLEQEDPHKQAHCVVDNNDVFRPVLHRTRSANRLT